MLVSAQQHAKADVIASRLQQLASKQSRLAPFLPANLHLIISLSRAKGGQYSPLRNMVMHSTRGLLGMHCVCVMDGCANQVCVCGQGCTVNHAMNCAASGFPTIRHNELRDIIAATLSKVCHNVAVEPVLQLLSGKTFHYATADLEDEACLDVSVQDIFKGKGGGEEITISRCFFFFLKQAPSTPMLLAIRRQQFL